ncbi:YfzA family protein [Paenibacillus daejeonensis]|uniref:YfzA family protein n=1 Tax=Paenibacillus daejeonensis TaxID=135193 RepID=UPI000369B2FB|nr:YfzA family protein [Paenibacillus daejeonensis]
MGDPTATPSSRLKSWVTTVLVFLLVQLIFLTMDFFALYPNLREQGNFARSIMDALPDELFTTWFAPYDFLFFNFVTAVMVVAIVLAALKDVIVYIFSRK